MVGIEQAFNQCVSFLPTTFRVWSQVQTQSKESLILEVVGRPCHNTCDIALGAKQEGGDKG